MEKSKKAIGKMMNFWENNYFIVNYNKKIYKK